MSRQAGRVAVVLVPGVGDEGLGETVDAVARALAERPEYDAADVRRIVVSPRPAGGGAAGDGAGEAAYTTSWARVRPAPALGHPPVDLYEMRWADLSRFPPGLVRFLFTLYALLTQMPTIGLEALRAYRPGRGRAGGAPGWARPALEVVSWLLAVPVVAVTGLIALLMAALYGAVVLDGTAFAVAAVPALAAVAALAAAVWGGRRLRDGGWGTSALIATVAIAVAGILLGAGRLVHDGDVDVALANALLLVVAYPFRGTWVLVGVAGVAATLALLVMCLRAPRRLGAAHTGLVSLAVAAAGLAVSGAMALAALAVLALPGADDHRWGAGGERLRCLPERTSWVTERCGAVTGAADWGESVFRHAVAPLYVVGVVGLLLLLTALARVGRHLPRTLRAFLPLRSDSPERARREGRALTGVLRGLGARAGAAPLALAILLAAAGIPLVWILDDRVASGNALVAFAGGSTILAGLLTLVRVLGIDPRRPGGTAGRLEVARRVLDVPYDIATYMRIGHGRRLPPRELMLRRLRALLAHLAAGGTDGAPYAGLVVAAHSQGTVLSAAALFGDPCRRPPAVPVDLAALPAPAHLLTFGSPLRQIYDARFPEQYAWVREPPAASDRVAAWTNVYRAGDYVGRSLWRDPTDAATYDVAAEHRRPGPGLPLRERCLGSGGHTGYWSDPRWVDELLRAVRAAGGGR